MQAKGIARRLTPILMGVREEVKEDKYTLVSIRPHDHATSKSPAACAICHANGRDAFCGVLLTDLQVCLSACHAVSIKHLDVCPDVLCALMTCLMLLA